MTRGYFDEMQSEGGVLRVSGWMLHPRRAFTSIQVVLNGRVLASKTPQVRTDVAGVFPWIPHAAQSGFRIILDQFRTGDRLEILGRRGRRVVARLAAALRTDLDTWFLTPPPELMRRVAGVSGPGYKADGLRQFTEISDVLVRHELARPARHMLDWGCGCGRLTSHFLHAGASTPKVFGCDIDREAILWCQENLPSGEFCAVDPYPPTPYPDGFFDRVVAYSVFTHLNEATQRAWLAEMRRIIAPGGLFLASVHGRFAADFAFPPHGSGFIQRLRQRLRVSKVLASGFSDVLEDSALDGIAPAGYYRATFQTRAYTRREWSKYFEILEIAEAYLGHQDLVVMRRPEQC